MNIKAKAAEHRGDITGAVENLGYALALTSGSYIVGYLDGKEVSQALTLRGGPPFPPAANYALYAAVCLIMLGVGVDYLTEKTGLFDL